MPDFSIDALLTTRVVTFLVFLVLLGWVGRALRKPIMYGVLGLGLLVSLGVLTMPQVVSLGTMAVQGLLGVILGVWQSVSGGA